MSGQANFIKNADCSTGMRSLPDAQVDLVITDPFAKGILRPL